MAGQTVSGRIVAPQPDVRISTYFAANGWLMALLHLTAVASTGTAGAVAIDEMENGLHPYAIRQLIEAMRRWADQTGISIVLATHSPVVLDQFKAEPDHLFVMEPGREEAPIRLDELLQFVRSLIHDLADALGEHAIAQRFAGKTHPLTWPPPADCVLRNI